MRRPVEAPVAYSPMSWGARCDVCPLRTQGATVVPPKWTDPRAAVPLVLVGEAPGVNEVKRREPFVGPSGVKLDELLWKTGLKRSQVLLTTNTLLCRPEVPDQTGRKRFDVKGWVAWWRRENKQRKKFEQPLMESPFACCYPRLRNELATAEQIAQAIPSSPPKRLVVMPMGNFALGAVQEQPGKAYGIMKYRGSVIEPGKEPGP
jgi:uracil-DNA glycosylase